MKKIAIIVENISKRYRIGIKEEKCDTLSSMLMSWIKLPLLNYRRLRQLSQFDDLEDASVVWALKDVSFDVEQGEAVAIIGGNGSGKSTLLKIVSRITQPTGGSVRFVGRVSSLLEVGTGFHPELTGRENVYLNGSILGMSKSEIDGKFDEIVAFSEVEKFLDTPVKRYSSGMRVRLAFAVAAHLEPEILLIDEVLAVGDDAFQRKCLGKMKNVAHDGRTVLFVSHNLRAVQKLCARSIVLEKGRLIFDGDTQQAIDLYLSSRDDRIAECGDVKNIPRRNGLSELIRFNSCILLNSEGIPTKKIQYGQSFSVSLEIEAFHNAKKISVLVGINTWDECRVTTLASEENGIFFDAIDGELLRVNVSPINLTLKPGKYFISLGMRKGNLALDHLPYVLSFEIAKTVNGSINLDPNIIGLINTSADWDRIESKRDLEPIDKGSVGDQLL